MMRTDRLRGRVIAGLLWICAACAADPLPMDDAGAGNGSAAGMNNSEAGAAGSATAGVGEAGTTAGSGASSGTSGDGASGASGQTGAGEGGTGAMIDDLGTPIEPGDPGASDVQLTVRSDRDVHAIDPRIYGTNGAPEINVTHQTVVRSGGNRLTAYNWENNASNAGSDWMFQNDGHLDASDEPGKVVLDVVRTASDHGAAAIVTVPIVDYVAADKNGGGDVRNSGSDYLQTRFRKNFPAKGSAFADAPDVSDDSVYQDELVSFVKKNAPAGTEVLFSLDNEPDLWSHTHAEIHPEPVTYQEVWDRNRDYARAIKAVWPEAEVLGLVSYGFNGYMTLQDAPDADKGELLDWYLKQAKAEHDATGERLIDYLDLHWYPEARGGGQRITEQSNDAAIVAARLQAPRSLWDASYLEDSWIRDVLGRPIDLLHWVLAKISSYYPGTKLAITEWSYGGGNHISGALAVADVLGIFGREGVSLANYWALGSDERFAWAGFRTYRNFDGNGERFGDTSMHAESSEIEQVTLYASFDQGNAERVVIVAINKSDSALRAGLTIAHPSELTQSAHYVLSGSEPSFAQGADVSASAENAFLVDLPAQSVSVLVPR